MRILVTAGATCEDLDDVRCITNRSSGRMGCAVAAEALRRGHQVDLVVGQAEVAPPTGAEVTRVRTTEDLLRECRLLFPHCDALVMSAAVADYRPAERAAGKMKKKPGKALVLKLVSNPDVSAELGATKRPRQIIVGFALESAEPASARKSAEAKMKAKRQDLAVLNGPAALGAEEAEVSFLSAEGGWAGPERLTKAEIARRIVDFIESETGGGP